MNSSVRSSVPSASASRVESDSSTSRPEVARLVTTPSLRSKMLDLLPAATRVLLLGEADETFAKGYEQRHPGVLFLRPGEEAEAIRAAAESCDLVVMPDGLGALTDPLPLLKLLAQHGATGLSLFVEFSNPAAGVSACDAVSPLDHAGLAKRGSRAALAKLLMDAGWMPNAADYTLQQCTRRLVDGIIIEATRTFDAADLQPPEVEQASRFSVVVPTTRTSELESNVNCSPGLGEVRAPIFAVRDAASPADALNTALPHFAHDWVLICHQDVYFPEGFGRRLNDLLASIPAAERDRTLLGFVGISADPKQGGYRNAGFMIDRLHRMDYAESTTAISIDEAALVLSRQSLHRIDAAMGWHLWATDLCLTAICRLEIFPRIVRLPLFHNSANDSELSEAFHASSARILEKFPDFGPVPTLCGTIVPAEATAPLAAPSKPVAAPPKRPGCCICDQPVGHWLPHAHIAERSEFMKLLDAVGSDLSVYQCPACHSTDRDRHLWHYMKAVGLLDRMASMRVLHIAPERHIEALLLQTPPLEYVRGDLHPQRAEHRRLDVESLGFADASFDLIICNHVLEHVSSPARALTEFNRCLCAGGLLIAQTPYAPNLRHTFEMQDTVSPAFARLFYGQDDHVRLFGADIVALFHAAGFRGDLLPHRVVLPDVDAKANGCNEREPFFCFSK